MALKVLMLKKRLDDKRKALEALKAKDTELEAREKELEGDIAAAQTEEEQQTVEAAVDAFNSERKNHEDAKSALETEISALETDLAAEEARQNTPQAATAPAAERKDEVNMEIRDKFFGITVAERDALFQREDVKHWLGQIRTMMQNRGVANGSVLVPQVMLPYLRQVIEASSKLMKHVNLVRIKGEGRQIVDGGFPEAVWTEMVANLNELEIGFNDVEIFGFKVGGFVAIPNSLLEDSDIALATDVITKIGEGIGYGVDKAILYGAGSRMPMGIVTRLAQTSQPENYPATERPWADLHTSNIKTISVADTSGATLFKKLVLAFGAAKNKFAKGDKWWAMNDTTKTTLMAEALSINAAGAIVTGVSNQMPVIGGDIELLDFIPDNVIIAGYDKLYILAEREGLKTGESEHVKFTEDKTVFKGTARYDGKPVIAEGFVAIGINNTSVSADAVSFAADDANSVQSIRLNTATASVAVGGTLQLRAFTEPGKGTVTWASGTEAKATVDSTGKVTGVATGSSVITASCNGLTAQCTVTVVSG